MQYRAELASTQVRFSIGSLTAAAVVLVPGVVLVGFAAAGAWQMGLVPTAIVLVTLWLLHGQIAALSASARDTQRVLSDVSPRAKTLRDEVDGLHKRLEGHQLELQHARETTAFALTKLVEARDPSTGVHLERVRAYAKLLATHLGQTTRYRDLIDDHFIHMIYVASPLHDIGKVGIADMILLKPGRLTPDETALMRRHATLGGRALRAIARRDGRNPFVETAYDVAMYHHEKWDGSGYPFGLSGHHIPLTARIVALADVYDALTSQRCYKPAFSHTDARAYVIEESGKHFDPEVVEAFMARELDFVRIREALTGDHAIQSEDLPELGRSSSLRGAA